MPQAFYAFASWPTLPLGRCRAKGRLFGEDMPSICAGSRVAVPTMFQPKFLLKEVLTVNSRCVVVPTILLHSRGRRKATRTPCIVVALVAKRIRIMRVFRRRLHRNNQCLPALVALCQWVAKSQVAALLLPPYDMQRRHRPLPRALLHSSSRW